MITLSGARIVCLETDERALETAILAATLNILNYSYNRPFLFIFFLDCEYSCYMFDTFIKGFLDAFYSRRNLNLDLPSSPFSF